VAGYQTNWRLWFRLAFVLGGVVLLRLSVGGLERSHAEGGGILTGAILVAGGAASTAWLLTRRMRGLVRVALCLGVFVICGAVAFRVTLPTPMLKIRNETDQRVEVNVLYIRHGCLPAVTAEHEFSIENALSAGTVRLGPGERGEIKAPTAGVFGCIDWQIAVMDDRGEVLWLGSEFDISTPDYRLLEVDREKVAAS